MRIGRIAFLSLLALAATPASLGQDSGGFELPVQLIGFPIIIVAVRLANFIKKLTYALNPNTYRSRTKRSTLGDTDDSHINVDEMEKKLVSEMGQGFCIYEKVCNSYARKAPAGPVDIDWNDIFRKYATYPKDLGESYILSVFLGDIVGSPALCRGLAKRGRDCDNPRRGLLPFISTQPPPPLPQIYNFHPQITS